MANEPESGTGKNDVGSNSPMSGKGGESKAAPTSESSTSNVGSKMSNTGGKIGAAKDAIKDPKKAVTGAATNAAKNAAKNVVGQNETVNKAAEVAEKAQNMIVAAKSAFIAAKTGLVTFVTVVIDPVFWIVVLAIVVIVSFIVVMLAAVQVVGRTDNADGCGVAGDSSPSGIEAEDKGNWQENAKQIGGWLTSTKWSFLGDKPMTKIQAAGIIGNLKHESGGTLDPTITQIGAGVPRDGSNAQIAAISGYNKAVGIVQWDGSRRTNLANFATSEGGMWNTIDIQMKFLKKELEESYGTRMVAAGFNDSNANVESTARVFVSIFEVPASDSSGEWLGMADRIAAGNEFMGFFDGGYTGDSGGSCVMAGSSDVDASDLVQLAISMSYPTSAESKVGPGDSYGQSKAKPEYLAAKAKAQKETSADPMPTLYASCDRFVATVIRLTRDPDIPWGSTTEQGIYLKNSPKWKQYTTQAEAQAGDIWVTRVGGHVVLYLGEVNGERMTAGASYLDRVAALTPAKYWTENITDNSGRAYYGYTFVG